MWQRLCRYPRTTARSLAFPAIHVCGQVLAPAVRPLLRGAGQMSTLPLLFGSPRRRRLARPGYGSNAPTKKVPPMRSTKPCSQKLPVKSAPNVNGLIHWLTVSSGIHCYIASTAGSSSATVFSFTLALVTRITETTTITLPITMKRSTRSCSTNHPRNTATTGFT